MGHRRDDTAGQVMLAAERSQNRRRSLAAAAEMKVVPDNDARDAELSFQQVSDELRRRGRGEGPVEPAHERAVKAELSQDGEFHGLRREPNHRFIGGKELPWMRL